MAKKPTYEELERRVKDLDKKSEGGEYKQLWSTYSQSPIPTLILSRGGGITDYNDAMTELTGFVHEEVPDIDVWMPKIYPDEEYRNKVSKVSEKSRYRKIDVKRDEFIIATKAGEKRHVEFSVFDILHKGKPIDMQVVQGVDITEKAQMKEELQRSHVRLEQQVKDRTSELLIANEKLKHEMKAQEKVEEALRESEEKHRSMVDDVIDGIDAGLFILDSDYKVVWINEALERYFGLQREEIIGKDKRQLIREQIKYKFEEPEEFAERVLATYDNNTYVENFECHVLPIGEWKKRHLEHWSRPIRSGLYAGGRVELYYDVTERKRTEEALLFKEDIIRSSSSIIATCDLEGNMTFGNPAFLTKWGFDDAKEFMGKPFTECWAVKDRLDEIMQALLQGEGNWFGEIKARRKDGTLFDVQILAATVFDGKGNPIALTSTSIDITDRKRMEKALQQRTHELGERVKELDCLYGISSLVEKPDISLEEIFQGVVDLIPPSWQYPEITCSHIILEDKKYKTINFKETEWKQSIEILANGKRKGILEIFYLEEKPEIYEGPFLKEERYLINAIAERLGSIIERMSAKEDKRRLESQLQQAQKMESVGILSGGIAHDFNNLLSIIIGNIELAKDDITLETGASGFLNEAREASLKAQELTKQLITFSKGGAPFKEIGSIEDLVKKIADTSLSDTDVKCEFNISSDLHVVKFDRGQMNHAVKNIIINAVESMSDSGSIVVKADNFTKTAESDLPIAEGNYVKISIRDQGIGIPEEHLSKIFDPYFSTKERGPQKGMGLGLAITYSIINRHDGHVAVESEAGVGTTLTIYLPAVVEEIVGIEPVKMAKPEKAAVRTGRILVMDDEEMIRNLSKQMLSRLGYEPEVAKNGTEAVELYGAAKDSGKPFDVVILDLTIKGGAGGKEVIKKLMAIDPDIKAIVSSGYSNDPVMTDFRAYGFIGALPKPHTINDLIDMLNKVIMGKG